MKDMEARALPLIGRVPQVNACEGKLKDRRDNISIAYIGSLFELRLFRRMRRGLFERGWELHVVTHLLSVWVIARSAHIPCSLVRCGPLLEDCPGLDPELSPEYLQGLVSGASATRFQKAVWRELKSIHSEHRIAVILLWNGLRLAGQAANAFAKEFAIPTVFLELGNIDSKLFIDSEGVNGASRVARYPSLLNALKFTEEEAIEWRRRFVAEGLQINRPPQASLLRKVNWWFPVDLAGAAWLRVPQPFELSIWKKIVAKIELLTTASMPCCEPATPYLFLPLQVSIDSNLLLFSKIGNIAAIEYAEAMARERGCSLAVKIHPAETSAAQIEEIVKLCRDHGNTLTGGNTTRLILGAEEVVTINSTVGLEALLHGKKVTVLGESLYSRFSMRQAIAYVLRHLVDFNPYGSEPVSEEALDRIIGLVESNRSRNVTFEERGMPCLDRSA